ncbi:NADPH-dependent FMN reductase [Variovorax sp. M-6]|uniref:NADPH-dependent FMN reductase n=1 Tax=Variovorax sp. M-6 TaxID=3233041 RepID=UPI003F967042
MKRNRPYIVAIGGTTRPGSSTERALRHALASIDADTALLCGDDLDLPLFAPHNPVRTPAVERLLQELRRADGVLIGSPGYHGGMSGVIKNALDHTEHMRDDDRPYLSGRAVGCVATASGWQAAVMTLGAMRDVVHALRGWPTPLGVCVAGTDPAFAADGRCLSPLAGAQLATMAHEVLEFALLRRAAARQPESAEHAL